MHIVLIAANRENYFKQVFESIYPQVNNRHLHVFIDFCGDSEVQQRHKKIVLDKIPTANIILREKHYGCGNNIIDARRYIFDEVGANYAFIMEDDLVISPSYIKLCENLMEWAELNYTNIGAVQSWNHCTLTENEKGNKENEIYTTYYNWWGYLLKRSAWDSIKDYLYEFQDRFLRKISHYNFRNHKSINDWMKQKQLKTTLPEGERLAPTCDFSKQKLDMYINKSLVTGQDAATMRAFLNAGLARITTVANRSLYIGASGVHKTPHLYAKMGYDKINMFIGKNDDNLREFKFTV